MVICKLHQQMRSMLVGESVCHKHAMLVAYGIELPSVMAISHFPVFLLSHVTLISIARVDLKAKWNILHLGLQP